MLNTLKGILTNIRQEREKKLNNTVFVNRYGVENAKALLILELPFSTTPEAILKARAEVYNAKQQKKRKKYHGKTAQELTAEWCNEEEKEDRNIFIYFLKLCGLKFHYDSGDAISAEDLFRWLPLDHVHDIISRSDYSASTKDKYQSFANSLYEFAVKDNDLSPGIIRKQHLPLSDAGQFFEYLERRALKGTTVRAYEDLLLSRALFCIPLPAKKFFSIESLAESSQSVVFQGDRYPISQSFIDLWKGFERPSLFAKTLNERLLHQKISRLGEYAGLSEKLTPSVLRTSLDPICQGILNVDEEVLNALYLNQDFQQN